MKDFPRRTLEEMLLKRVRKPYPAENLQLLFPEERAEKGVVGAAYYGMDRMKKTDARQRLKPAGSSGKQDEKTEN